MGKTIKNLEILGDLGLGQVDVLFDSGASESLVRKSAAEKVATIIKLRRSRQFSLADGRTKATTDLVANVMVTVNRVMIDDQFYVLEHLARELILGAPTMQK